MTKIPLLIFCLTITSNLFPQSVKQIKSDTLNYIWGEGSGTTMKKADQMAIVMLLDQVSVKMGNSFDLLKSEFDVADENSKFKDILKSNISTYSGTTFKNSEKIVISNEPEAKVLHYIKRDEADRIFYERKNKIISFVRNGEDALSNNQVSDALRYYYWALSLLRSHPDGSSITFTNKDQKINLLATWLPMQINSIFNGLTVAIAAINSAEKTSYITLFINFHDKPVSNLDYCYWEGNGWSDIISAKDGLGYVELKGLSISEYDVKLKVEYLFEEEAAVDNELRDVMKILDPLPFLNSSLIAKKGIIPISKNDEINVMKRMEENAELWQNRSITFLTEVEQVPFKNTMDRVTDSFKKKDFAKIQNDFTSDGFKVFQDLVQYGQARIIDIPSYKFVRFGDNVICRSLSMSFKFANNYKQFVEDIVFHFDSTGKIFNLSFGLGAEALRNIVSKDIWNEQVRLVLITFLEDYKTAYALKRLSYIESIFSDEALIIVGSVLKANREVNNPYLDNKIIKYNRYTKTEYMNNLKLSFQSNEFINLKFEDNEIRKSGKGGEVYGIQIKQNYSSSTYGDEGYLFLMVDLNNPELPIIHVRTWQPQKNPDGSIYGLGDFN